MEWLVRKSNTVAFIDKLLERKTSWTPAGGDCKQLELDHFTIRWYYKNKSLTVSGEESDNRKSQQRGIAHNPSYYTFVLYFRIILSYYTFVLHAVN